MAQIVPLNNVEHRDLRINTGHAAVLGDDVMAALTFPAEFRLVQAHYPIVFQRGSASSEFQPLALLGLRANENLFLGPGGWEAAYVPASVRRLPFYVGAGPADGSGAPALGIHIDLDSPRVSRTIGEPLFREQGGHTDFLSGMNDLLYSLHDGVRATAAFVAALEKSGLLESFVLDVDAGDGAVARLSGFHTVNYERLRNLAPESVAELHRAGFLEPAYMVVASMVHLGDLVERQLRRRRG